ncbi:MAG: glycosyltransferase family 4 protein [Bacteriovoracaceae bacterium]|nr:glycosyltransferase family 4 protein [Bacteriovoracaceae bacterium]
MKILCSVQFYHPAKGGMEEVVKQLSTHFSMAGHDVTVATSANTGRSPDATIDGVRVKSFNIKGNLVKGISGEAQSYLDFLKSEKADIYIFFAAQQWSTDLALGNLHRLPGKKVFVPTGFSSLVQSEYSQYFEKMKTWLKEFDLNVFHSKQYQDYSFAVNNEVMNNCIIPNGVNQNEFSNVKRITSTTNTSGIRVLSVGNHTGVKGHSEIIEIFSKAKLPDGSSLTIVGEKNFKARCYLKCLSKAKILNLINKKKEIKIVSTTRKELLDLFYSSDIFLFPSNIECSPLVLFESAAAGLPFLATDVGNSTEISELTGAGIILETRKNINGYSMVNIKDAISKLETLANNQDKRAKMSKSGVEVIAESYTWEKISHSYLKNFEDLLN